MLGRWFSLLLLVGVAGLLAWPESARADNCVDRRKLAPGDPGRPCLDLSASMGRIESYTSPGRSGLRVDARLTGPYISLFGNGRSVDDRGSHAGLSIDSFTWESLNLGDGEYRFLSAAGVRYRRDSERFGYYLGATAATRWHDRYRILTPYFGLRVGRFDRAALIAEARLSGLYLYSSCADCRSASRDYDLSLRSTLVLRPALRLEARARARNLTVAEAMRQSDVMVTLGVEGSIRDKLGFRVTPTFLGLGFRYVVGHDEWKYHPMHERDEYVAVEQPGFEVLLLCDVDFTVASSDRVW